jgi:hypothetical protein
MSDYLNNVGGAGAAVEKFGYASLMEAWKANNVCLMFYSHGDEVGDLTGPEMQALVEIFQEDGDFWIPFLSEVGDYITAGGHHAPFGPVYNNAHVEELIGELPAAPWNGKKAAICFSLDDPRLEAYTVHFPRFVAIGAKVTIGVALNYNEVTTVRLQEMADSGVVEIAGHSVTHPYMVDENACVISKPGGNFAVGVETVGGVKQITLYDRAEVSDWYDPIAVLPGFNFLFEANTLTGTVADGGVVSTISKLAGTAGNFTQSTNDYRPLYQTNETTTGLGVLQMDGTNDKLTAVNTLQVGSNTDGLTLFAVVRQLTALAGQETFWAKSEAGDGTRLFRMERAYAWIWDGIGGASQATWKAGGLTADGLYHIMIATWFPNGGLTPFIDGYVTPGTAGGNLAAINLTSTSIHRLGTWAHETSTPWNGYVAAWGALSHGFYAGSYELYSLYTALKARYG